MNLRRIVGHDPWSCCDGRSIEHKSARTWDQRANSVDGMCQISSARAPSRWSSGKRQASSLTYYE
jgi:hypothetical protein